VEGVVAPQLIIGVTEWAAAASSVVCFCLVLRLGVMSQCLALRLPWQRGRIRWPVPCRRRLVCPYRTARWKGCSND